MLGSVVLDDAFEAIVPHGDLATIAEEDFLPMSFSVWLDLDVIVSTVLSSQRKPKTDVIQLKMVGKQKA